LLRNDTKVLERLLLAAHSTGDHVELANLYIRAADLSDASGSVDAACFYLTHAYVFALEQGMDTAKKIHARLVVHGREE